MPHYLSSEPASQCLHSATGFDCIVPQTRAKLADERSVASTKVWNSLAESVSAMNTWQFLPRCMECRRGLVMRIICLSVRTSVKRVHCDKTEEKCVQIFIPYERFSLIKRWKEWLVEATPSTWNFRSAGPCWSEIAYFEQIIARSASAVAPGEKSSINTIESPLRSLQWA